MKVSLLGHSGFVGASVAIELAARNIDFFPVSRKTGYDLRSTADNLRFVKDSQCTHIINCAAHVGNLGYYAKHPAKVLAENSRMLLGLYEAVVAVDPNIVLIQPVANVVFPGTATIYKESELFDGPQHPTVMPYGASKRLLLSLADCYRQEAGIRTISILTPNMYGPDDSIDPDKAHALNALILRLLQAVEENKPQVSIWGSGTVVREWLYTPDYARFLVDLINVEQVDHLLAPFNIAQNYGVSIRDLVSTIATLCGYNGSVHWDISKPDGTALKRMDDTNFRKLFPDFTFTPLEDALKSAMKYYEKQKTIIRSS